MVMLKNTNYSISKFKGQGSGFIKMINKTIQVMGKKNSGKTYLVNAIIKGLREHGVRAGTLKHTPHDHPLDKPGSDSDQHRRSGAFPAVYETPSGMAVFYDSRDLNEEIRTKILATAFQDVEIVIVESFNGNYGPVIAVVEPEDILDLDKERVLAIVNREGKHNEFPAFRASDNELIKHILKWIETKKIEASSCTGS